MGNEKIWMRTLSGTWIPCGKNKINSRLILKNVDSGKYFCPNHCEWEEAPCESSSPIFIAPFVPLPPLKAENPLYEPNQDDIKKHHDLCKQKLADSLGISKDAVLIMVENIAESLKVILSFFYIPRKSFENRRKGSFDACAIHLEKRTLTFDIKKGKFYGIIESDFLPEQILKVFGDEIKKNIYELAQKKVSFSQKIEKISDARPYTRTPLELNLYPLVARLSDFSIVKNDDFECFNHICTHFKIRPTPTVRKHFAQNPFSLVRYIILEKFGFRDINVISKMLGKNGDAFFKNVESNDYYYVGRSLSDIENYYKSFAFFFKKSIKLRGEAASMRSLLKYENVGWRELSDLVLMFEKYYQYLPKKICEEILREGFTINTHNILSKFAYSLKNKKIRFKYNKNQKNLEENIAGWNFLLPKDSYVLKDIGIALHNCVASYADSVTQSKCTIVYATHENEFKLCIEIRGNEIQQYRANYNRPPTGDDLQIFKLWAKNHSLSY